jgi:hypothetical protein
MDFFQRVDDENGESAIDWSRYEFSPIITLRDMPRLTTFPCFDSITILVLENLPLLLHLPAEFTKLKILTELRICNTGLLELPSNFDELENLSRLEIWDNKSLPKCLTTVWVRDATLICRKIHLYYRSREVAHFLLLAREHIWQNIPREVIRMIAEECIVYFPQPPSRILRLCWII